MKQSEFEGIVWNATANRWMALLAEAGKDECIGLFPDDLAAASKVNDTIRERIQEGSKARYKFHRLREHFALRRVMNMEDEAP